MKNIIYSVTATCMVLAGSALAGTLKVDKDKSRIQVDAKATGHAFTGTLSDYTIAVSGDDASLAPTAVSLSWKFADLKTGDEKRDAEMVKWLGGGGPEGSFKFIKTWEEGGKMHALGSITIHGISKQIGFPYTVKKEGDWIMIDGTASLDYQNFSLPIIKNMAVMKVEPGLSVRFHLVGRAN